LGIPIIHFSTDYVFDGNKPRPYDETDPVAPQSVYGRTKLAGEVAVAHANPRHIILRTAWVYAPFGKNFVCTMLRLAQQHERLRVVGDQIGCPTYAPDIAQATLQIARLIAQSGWRDEFAGVTHLAGPDALTWREFAELIMDGAAVRGARAAPVDSITTVDYPTPARRPANSRLATDRLAALFDVHVASINSSLDRCLDALLGPAPVAAGPKSAAV
jgi:dTDP-4-dehydrorhamnose reductase